MPELIKFKDWDQDPNQSLNDSDIIKMYEKGFAGAKYSPEAIEEYKDTVSIPRAEDVCRLFGLEEESKGDLITPFTWVTKYYPNAWPGPAQVVGDCFMAGAMVTMADGSKKPIEQVSVGEQVLTHKGNIKRVESLVSKKSNNFVEITVDKYHKNITSTADHVYPTLNSIDSEDIVWKKGLDITSDDYLVLGKPNVTEKTVTFDMKDYGADLTDDLDFTSLRLQPVDFGKCRAKSSQTKSQVNRFVKLDDDLAYIIGAFLAEGSCDHNAGHPSRITFNLGHTETLYAKKIARCIEKCFGVTPSISSIPSKPTVLYVRLTNIPVATLLYRLCGEGNTYSKRCPWQILSAAESTKLELLRGWIDGDGYTYSSGRTVGCTISPEMATTLQELANSCGLDCRIAINAQKDRSDAYRLSFSQENATALQKQAFIKTEVTINNNKYGIPVKVKEVNSFTKYNQDVYCINVEDDHSFICDGFSVHNCVSQSQRNANLLTVCTEVASGTPDAVSGKVEKAPIVSAIGERNGVFSTEAIYWFRGYDGHGWFCHAAAKTSLTKAGCILRENIDGVANLEEYKGRNTTLYGSRKPPADVVDKIDNNLLRESTEIDSFEELRDLIGRGFGVTSCGSEGFSSQRDENGVSKKSGRWAHAMAYIAVDDRPEIHRKYGGPLVLVLNSWGSRWNRGPRRILGTQLDIPEGAFWARWSDLRARSTIAMAGANGWERERLPRDFAPDFV